MRGVMRVCIPGIAVASCHGFPPKKLAPAFHRVEIDAVTSQVSRGGSGGVEFVDQVFGVSHEALDDTPAALFGSADERSDRSEIVCTLERAEAARDFLLELHHPAVAFSLVVGERHIRVGQEAQNSLFVVSQAQDEVMPDATLWAAG